ncbi:Com family DNA-binding transcriptional regulator [Chromobacterium phragmitis]|uniref:Com family DNA-binding transcriptional regulator n=1 Tax=Chromobacterium phragmitis TaxID=2202141 RepID=A0A344UCY4_9NEIS|nr:Com family DNA-binding transcriptional regulator [Chromobacterium phragmitis]AXE33132.1 Com family DNA-binding transcriptional regulator [Chromobacterium phragmitis]
MFNTEIRCGQCGRKLATGRYIELTIKCPRCRTLNHLKAESLPSERPGASDIKANHDQAIRT